MWDNVQHQLRDEPEARNQGITIMDNLTKSQAIDIVGQDAVDKIEYVNCEPTGNVGYNGLCQGDDLIEWTASVHGLTDSDGNDCSLTAYYYTTQADEHVALDSGDWANVDFKINHYKIR